MPLNAAKSNHLSNQQEKAAEYHISFHQQYMDGPRKKFQDADLYLHLPGNSMLHLWDLLQPALRPFPFGVCDMGSWHRNHKFLQDFQGQNVIAHIESPL